MGTRLTGETEREHRTCRQELNKHEDEADKTWNMEHRGRMETEPEGQMTKLRAETTNITQSRKTTQKNRTWNMQY